MTHSALLSPYLGLQLWSSAWSVRPPLKDCLHWRAGQGFGSALLPAWWLGLFRASKSTLGTSELSVLWSPPWSLRIPSDKEESVLLWSSGVHSCRKNVWNCEAVWKVPTQPPRGQCLIRYSEHYSKSWGGARVLEQNSLTSPLVGETVHCFLPACS